MLITKCRICQYPLTKIISFGKMPTVNYYLTKEELTKPEKKIALNFCICEKCTLGQLDEIIDPKDMFITYHYASSVSKPLKEHLENLAEISLKRFNLTEKSRVVDIGCNDGVLLHTLKKRGVQTLGIDPAKNIVSKLKELDIPVTADFFSYTLAKKMQSENLFDVIFATNTLAQVVDINDFVKGIKLLLQKDGIFIAEVGYLLDMIMKKTFDSIYHEHYSYFSLQALLLLFAQNGLTIFDAEQISNHGGSLRLYVTHSENKKRKVSHRLQKILHNENNYHLNQIRSYASFIKYCINFKKNFKNKLLQLKKANKTIIGVTSPAKGVIIFNYCGITSAIVDFIVDSTPYKQFHYMPGVHIPIYPEEKLQSFHADYLIILAWTYKDELLKKLQIYRKNGSKIILPLPTFSISE